MNEWIGYSDADWAGNVDESTSGYVFQISNAAVAAVEEARNNRVSPSPQQKLNM
jgi:hypothetical protein